MKNNKDGDSSNHYSSTKTNSSSKNDDNDIFAKNRPRGGIKSKINNFQPGRHTVAVPLNSFSGISHNASFQSKLLFFNGGKPRPKYQHTPHDKAIVEENDKKENLNIKKTTLNKEDKNKKTKIEKDDLDSNININKLLDAKNSTNSSKNTNNNSNSNSNNNNDDIRKIKNNLVKKNSICYSSNQYHSFSMESKKSNPSKTAFNNDKKGDDNRPSSTNIKLKSLQDQWDFQKILLDYNILDFTSKYKNILLINFI